MRLPDPRPPLLRHPTASRTPVPTLEKSSPTKQEGVCGTPASGVNAAILPAEGGWATDAAALGIATFLGMHPDFPVDDVGLGGGGGRG